MQTGFQAGATSKSLLFRAFTTSTGAAKTDLVYNTSGLTCTYFTLNTLASGTVTLATLATPTTAYSSGGFVHIAGGLYRLDVPNAQIASGDYTAFVLHGVTDCTIVPDNSGIDILGVNPRSSSAVTADITSWNGTAVSDAELSAVPAANASLDKKVNWLFMKARNKITQTATTQIIKADDGTTTVATSTVSDDGTTATRGEFA